MTIPYPCLDTGYIFDPGKKLDRVMSDFYEAEFSQSRLFYGSISSFPYILQKWQDDPYVVSTKAKDTLTTLLGKHFDSCEVEFASDQTESNLTYNLRSFISVTQDGQTVTLWEQLKITGTQFERSLATRE